MHGSITLCQPKVHPIYFVLAVVTFAAPPILLTIYYALTELLDSKIKIIFGILPMVIIGFIPAFFYIYLYVPFLAVYHGLQGFYPAKFDSVKRFPTIEDAMDITFLKLFQQYGEALPQFLLALLYYMNNTYFINNNVKYFDLTLISMFFSGGSVVLGLFSGLATTKITYIRAQLPGKLPLVAAATVPEAAEPDADIAALLA